MAQSEPQEFRQHRVLRQITESFGRLLARGLKECGQDASVQFQFQEPGAKSKPHITVINYWVERHNDRNPDRVLSRTPQGDEYFRNPPIYMTARYMVTAWATPPADQDIVGAIIRYCNDNNALQPDGEGDEDAIHFEDKPTIEQSNRFSFDEAKDVLTSFGMPFRPSVRYDVTYRIDSEVKTAVKRVKERIVDYRKLD